MITKFSQGGAYIFQLMDFYSASGLPLLWSCFFQTIAISWIFGADKFCDCVHQMMGIRPNKFWYICWVYLAPSVMIVRQNCAVWELFNSILGMIIVSVHLHLLHHSVRAHPVRHLPVPDLGRGDRNLHQSHIHGVDTGLRHLLCAGHSWFHQGCE